MSNRISLNVFDTHRTRHKPPGFWANAFTQAAQATGATISEPFHASKSREQVHSVETTKRARKIALRLEDITLSFGGVTAVANVDLEVSTGEIRAIIGPNGAGKSSLINVISGIYQPNQGEIWIDAQRFKKVPTQRLARLGIARTFQNLALFKGLSVLDNVVIARVAHRKATFVEQVIGIGRARSEHKDALDRAKSITDFLDLTAVNDRLVGTLPYGLQKRVELARALVARPKILLLDEPMAGMTLSEKQEMTRFIRAARDEFGTTVILIEHDIGVVMGLSDKVAVLDYGRKIADGTPAEVKGNQAVIDAYLGVAHEEEEEAAHV